MKIKTTLPLPRYTRRKWLKGTQTWGYFFEPPTWARYPFEERGPCPVAAEELGTDYAAVVLRAETILLPIFDTWRIGGVVDPVRKPLRSVPLTGYLRCIGIPTNFADSRNAFGPSTNTASTWWETTGSRTAAGSVLCVSRRWIPGWSIRSMKSCCACP